MSLNASLMLNYNAMTKVCVCDEKEQQQQSESEESVCRWGCVTAAKGSQKKKTCENRVCFSSRNGERKNSRNFIINFKVMYVSWFIHHRTGDQRPPSNTQHTLPYGPACCVFFLCVARIFTHYLMSFLHVSQLDEKLLTQRDCSILSIPTTQEVHTGKESSALNFHNRHSTERALEMTSKSLTCFFIPLFLCLFQTIFPATVFFGVLCGYVWCSVKRLRSLVDLRILLLPAPLHYMPHTKQYGYCDVGFNKAVKILIDINRRI